MTSQTPATNESTTPPATPTEPATNMLQEQADAHLLALEKKHKDGAGWFFWIAGLSIVNSGIILLGSDRSFVIGLGITQVIDAIAMAIAERSAQAVGVFSAIAFVLDTVVAGTFILWGVLARKYHGWAYLVGMALYALDGIIFILVKDFMSIAFHILALVFLFTGFRACAQAKQLKHLKSQVAAAK